MLDPNMKSTLYVRNVIDNDSITATPVLYLSNGKKIVLPDLTLEPAATVSISIGDALLKQGIAPYANLKGYLELDYTSSYDPVCATVVSVDTVHSVIFTYGFRPTAPAAITMKAMGKPVPSKASVSQRIDGVWWKYSATVSGFVSLSNTTGQNVGAQFTVSGADGKLLGTYPISLAAHTTDVVDVAELRLTSASAGGIQLTYTAPPDAILISGGMEDISTGYSATMSFRPSMTQGPSSATTTTTLTELGLMTGAPDPMMAFPAGTSFTPFSVLHNVSTTAVVVTPEVFWMDQGAMHRQSLPALNIPATQTVMLDTPSLLKQAGLASYNGMFNLTFKTQSSSDTLLLASGSVDQTGTYVFQVLPHEVKESQAKSISYWSTGNGDDTMVTVWNPADEAQDFLFTLVYAGGTYAMPLHLEARASRFFNIASIIHDQVPDAQGHVIPATVSNGSARISGTHASNEQILVDLDAGSYNVRKATCWYYCISCSGAINGLIGQPINIPVSGQDQMSFLIHDSSGSIYDYSGGASWSSSDTTVATVAGGGMGTGVAVGSFTANAFASLAIYNYYYCAYDAHCPDNGSVYGGGGGTVTPTVSISPAGPTNVPIYIDTNSPGATVGLTATGSPPGGSYVWTTADSKISLSTTTAAMTTVKGTTAGQTSASVTYTLSGQASPAAAESLYVQTPTTSVITSNTLTPYNNQLEMLCDGSSSTPNAYGYQRCVLYQIEDQNTTSTAIAGTYFVHEVVTDVYSNIGSNTMTGDHASNAMGIVQDQVSLFGSSGVPTNACAVASQTFSVSSVVIRVNCLKFSSTDVTISNITGSPTSCTNTCP